MAFKEWVTHLPTGQDTIATDQPELINDSSPGSGNGDISRVSQLHAIRDKAQYLALTVGSDLEESGTLRERVTTLEGSGGTDSKVGITAADTTTSFLNSKVLINNGIQSQINNPGGNEILQIQPTYGALINTICQGNDSRLSNARTPVAHASSHQNSGSDQLNVAGLSGVLATKQDADKLQGRALAATAPSNGQAIVWNSTGVKWEPGTVAGGASTFVSLTDTPSVYTGQSGKVAAVKGTEDGLEFISAGTPSAHATTHENGGGDEISVAGLNGVLADKQDANKIQARNVAATLPTDGQALVWNNSGAQWQPGTVSGGSYTPDTALPFISYVAGGQISAQKAFKTLGATTRVTLQDGVQRSFTGTLLFDFANGVADLGLDAGSEASSTWYYLYLVPSSGNNAILTLRASTSVPSTGPSGYSNFRYIGFFMNNAFSSIKPFAYYGNKFRYREGERAYESIDPPSTYTALSLAAFVPPVATLVTIDLLLLNSDGDPDWFYVRRTGDTNDQRKFFWNTTVTPSFDKQGASIKVEVETNSSQSIDHYWNWSPTEASLACEYIIDSIIDNYL